MTVILKDVTSSDLNVESALDTMEAEEVHHHVVNIATLDLDHRAEVTKETMEEVAAAEVKIEDIDEVGINGTIHHRQETDEMTCHRQTKE